MKGPECIIHEPNIDFGLLKVGSTSKSYITIENISNLPLAWHLDCDDSDVLSYF